ncbi:MAG: protoheme IX farnesyltransferase [Chloroflexota bacterium]
MTTVGVAEHRYFYRVALDYILVLKPRETSLLLFIAVCSGVVAGAGFPPLEPFLLASTAVLLGSAGCNGITNYLDMRVDAKMRRTCSRVLPSKRIEPPEKVLPLVVGLIVVGLALAWIVNPWCFLAGLVGSAASVAWRKTFTCTIFGIIASVAPVLIGWLAIRPAFSLEILFLCLLIAAWIPLHVWTLMISHREDYARAGLRYFPLSWNERHVIRVLVALSIVLFAVTLVLYRVGGFSWLYLSATVLLGVLMITANVHLMRSGNSASAWRVYKLSAFPYLGIVFLGMCLDIWLLGMR